jgi:hypothetical protein
MSDNELQSFSAGGFMIEHPRTIRWEFVISTLGTRLRNLNGDHYELENKISILNPYYMAYSYAEKLGEIKCVAFSIAIGTHTFNFNISAESARNGGNVFALENIAARHIDGMKPLYIELSPDRSKIIGINETIEFDHLITSFIRFVIENYDNYYCYHPITIDDMLGGRSVKMAYHDN